MRGLVTRQAAGEARITSRVPQRLRELPLGLPTGLIIRGSADKRAITTLLPDHPFELIPFLRAHLGRVQTLAHRGHDARVDGAMTYQNDPGPRLHDRRV